MNRFKCNRLLSLKNTKEKASKGGAMVGGISDQPADTPTKKPPKMKRIVRGCFRAVVGCFGSGCKVNGHHRYTDTEIGKCYG